MNSKNAGLILIRILVSGLDVYNIDCGNIVVGSILTYLEWRVCYSAIGIRNSVHSEMDPTIILISNKHRSRVYYSSLRISYHAD
jgi:hypothetical protein